MIQVNELRIGNFVLLDGKHFAKVECIDARNNTVYTENPYNKTLSGLTGDEWHTLSDFIQPIPLSPEILQACGFDLLNGIVGQYYLKTDRFLFSFYEGKNDVMIQDMKPVNTLARGIADLKINYLHQLQNIFYWITAGTELSVNLEKVKV